MIAVLVALAIAVVGAGSAQASVTYESTFGGTGTGAGKFTENEYGPGGIAINNSNGNVYVADPGQNRIQVFTATGEFIFMWGQSVDEGSGDLCTAASGHTCTAGAVGGTAGAFNRPQGVGIDQDTGDVYVQDANNNRVEKFTEDGQFILTWGKGVNVTTGANICTAASGNVCKPGAVSGNENTTPPTPSAPGVFAGWEQANGPGLTVDEDGFVYVSDPRAVGAKGRQARLQKFDPNGNYVSALAAQEENFIQLGLNFPPGGVGIAPDGHVYIMDESFVKQFDQSDFSVDGTTAKFDHVYSNPKSVFDGVRQVAVDPHNGFIFLGNGTFTNSSCPSGGPVGAYKFEEFHPSGEQVDCTVAASPPMGNESVESGMAVSASHKLYVGSRTTDEIRIYNIPLETPPTIGSETAGEITSKAVRLKTEMAGNLADTTYHIEYGPQPCSSSACQSTPESSSIGASFTPKEVDARVEGLTPGTTYYYRFVATNAAGPTAGADHKFATFPGPVVDNSCSNNLARQQTRSANLLDCRAYELVSAENTGGYNVESDLVPGGEPFGGVPGADGRVLYAVHDGGIPNSGRPTNRGPDPYVATRNAAKGRWETKYVGVPADAPSTEPFQSTVAGTDSKLETLAFGGPDICNPCFADNSGGIPVRTPDGALVQGMAGSLPVAGPTASGEVRRSLSEDGGDLAFGSMQRFEPAGNATGTDLTIYVRDLAAGTTEVVSTLPDGTTMKSGGSVAELDLSSDGSRALVGKLVSTDSSGNEYFNLYMHTRGSANSVQVVNTPGGVIYNGMTADGSKVFFTTRDKLADDTDTGADLFRADVGGSTATITRVSTGSGGAGNSDACAPPTDWNVVSGGPDCSIVALAGGAGVASGSGTAFFVSPEKLDGTNGIADQANLYMAQPGGSPKFVATIDSTLVKPGPQPPKHPLANTNIAGSSLASPGKLAVDQLTGDIYVIEHGAGQVSRFTSAGTPHNFTEGPGAGTNTIPALNVFSFPERAIGVDSSPASPFTGAVYVNNSSHEIRVFSSTGADLGTINGSGTNNGFFFEACGLAMDQSTGDLFVGDYSARTIWRYVPKPGATAPITDADYTVTGIGTEGLSPCEVGADTAGHAYALGYSTGPVRQYNVSEFATVPPSSAGKQIVDAGNSISTDPVTNELYVNRANSLEVFDSSGTFLHDVGDSSSLGVESRGVAINGTSGHVYATNGGAVVDFGIEPVPFVPLDNPAVLHGLRDSAVHHSGDLQVTPDGRYATFASVLPVTGVTSDLHYNVFRYDTSNGQVDCVSCNTTLATPTSDATLASNGLSLTDDGAVFFTSGEALVLRDNNAEKDAYEWKDGVVELISTGKDAFPSGILSATADGRDAYFFTRETLAPNDTNGTLMKIYDARESGGFFTIPDAPPCAASDECHGPSSQAVPQPPLGSLDGTGGNAPQGTAPSPTCKKGFVKKKGKCVKKKHKKKQHKRKGGRR